MTGIERLRDIAEDRYSGGMVHISVQKLREMCEQIESETVEALAFVREHGGLDEVKKRLMPSGMEWPMVDGKPIDFVTGYEPSLGVLEAVSIYSNGACEVMGHDGIIKDVREIHVATPKVLDADGEEIRVGDTVYLLTGDWCDEFPCLGYHGGEELEVFSLHADHVVGGIGCRDTRRPKGTCYPKPSQLTHERPESWERIEADAGKNPFDYCKDVGHRLDTCENSEAYKARDLVRRAKALAGVSE